MSELIRYVLFKQDTGKIYGIAHDPGEHEEFSYLAVPFSQAEPLITGQYPITSYIVKYSSESKKLELMPKYKGSNDSLNINDILYKVPETVEGTPDLLVLQDIPNKQWKIILSKSMQNNFIKSKVGITNEVFFSVTAKDDPTILYKSLNIELNALISDNYFIVPFTMPFETTTVPLSIFTTRYFEVNQFKRIF